MQRILFIRGGAIGDFLLTLPAVALVKERWPDARIEVLGYPAIAELGHQRGYFEAVRSMDQAGLTGFFIPDNILDPDWMDYFGSFDLIVSYLFDPDGLFRANLEKCGPGQILSISPKVIEGRPAAYHLAEPLKKLELSLASAHAKINPTTADQAAAEAWLDQQKIDRKEPKKGDLLIAHPGSGSAAKNWTVPAWQSLLSTWLQAQPDRKAVLVGGEAEGDRLSRLRQALPEETQTRLAVAENLPLPVVAALLQSADRFLGHDSGISHLAAAVDTPTLALFGPTDSTTWAPQGKRVDIIAHELGAIGAIQASEVLERLEAL